MVRWERVGAVGSAGVVSAYVYVMVVLVLFVLGGMLFGLRPTVVVSGSMGPVVSPGDVVLYARSGGLGIDVGEVVTFADEGSGSLVTHRVVAVTGEGEYVTRGDANLRSDRERVAPGQVVGVAQLLVPFVGLPALWLVAGPWWVLVLWFAGSVVAVQFWLMVVWPLWMKQARSGAVGGPVEEVR